MGNALKTSIICLCVSIASVFYFHQAARAEEAAGATKEQTAQETQQQAHPSRNNEIVEELKELKKRITELEDTQKGKAASPEKKQEGAKAATVSSKDVDLNIAYRLQPRLDFGDITKNKDGTSYVSDHDIYLRRLRIELEGSFYTKLKYQLVLDADKWEKTGNANAISVYHAYLLWELDEALNLMVGKENLPYSRVSLVSSSRQLLIERPCSTEAAKKFFGESEGYRQPKLEIKGKFMEGVAAYRLAVADGWHNGDSIQTGATTTTVYKSKPVYVARIELSPPGWTEVKRSDAHLGKGKHLTLGIDYAAQNDITYKKNSYEQDRTLAGVDLSGHYKGFTVQLEYNTWKVKFTDPSMNKQTPKGWYAQMGYFIDGINVEPAARYEIYDQDSSSDNKKETDITIGLNWYLKGHNLKVGLNRVQSKYQDGNSNWLDDSDKKIVYQLQGQMYF